MKRRKAKKNENIKQWKKGINNIKEVSQPSYPNNMRGGIRLV